VQCICIDEKFHEKFLQKRLYRDSVKVLQPASFADAVRSRLQKGGEVYR
jgi:hypothetical protein